VTGIEENTNDAIITVMSIYNMQGQRLKVNDVNELNTGVYIIQGLTKDGKLVTHKTILNPF